MDENKSAETVDKEEKPETVYCAAEDAATEARDAGVSAEQSEPEPEGDNAKEEIKKEKRTWPGFFSDIFVPAFAALAMIRSAVVFIFFNFKIHKTLFGLLTAVKYDKLSKTESVHLVLMLACTILIVAAGAMVKNKKNNAGFVTELSFIAVIVENGLHCFLTAHDFKSEKLGLEYKLGDVVKILSGSMALMALFIVLLVVNRLYYCNNKKESGADE